MKKAIFLDRDGTIIIDKIYLNDPQQIVYLPKAIDGLRRFQEHQFDLIVVTNQSGIPQGKVQEENLHKIHHQMQKDLRPQGITFKKFYYAPHPTDSGHPDRKPSPGMLLKGLQEFGYDPQLCWMIGDRMTDVEAGHRAGMKSILVAHPKENPVMSHFAKPEFYVQNLLEAAHCICR